MFLDACPVLLLMLVMLLCFWFSSTQATFDILYISCPVLTHTFLYIILFYNILSPSYFPLLMMFSARPIFTFWGVLSKLEYRELYVFV